MFGPSHAGHKFVKTREGGTEFNLQCTMASGGEGGAVSVNRPLYCQFIPFFSYR